MRIIVPKDKMRKVFLCHASSPEERKSFVLFTRKQRQESSFEQWSQKLISFLHHKTIISFSLHYRANFVIFCDTKRERRERRKSFCSNLKIRIEFQLVERATVEAEVSNELRSLDAEGSRHVVQGFHSLGAR